MKQNDKENDVSSVEKEADTIPKYVLLEKMLNRIDRAQNDLSLLKNVVDPRLANDMERIIQTMNDAWAWINEKTE